MTKKIVRWKLFSIFLQRLVQYLAINGYLLTQTAVDLVWYDPVGPTKTIITSCRSAIVTPGVSIRFDIFLLFFS